MSGQIVKIMAIGFIVFFLCAQVVILAKTPATQGGERQHNFQRTNLIRRAFVMTVDAGKEKEYAHRHHPIWPELEATLKEHGVRTYSIFLFPRTRQLFAYVEFDSVEQWNAVAETEVCKKWWAHMTDVMPSNPDNSPVSVELNEVFHMENLATPRHTQSGGGNGNSSGTGSK